MTLTINHNISSGSYMTFDHEIKLDMHLFLLLTQATVQLQHVDVFSFPYLFFAFENYKNSKEKKK